MTQIEHELAQLELQRKVVEAMGDPKGALMQAIKTPEGFEVARIALEIVTSLGPKLPTLPEEEQCQRTFGGTSCL